MDSRIMGKPGVDCAHLACHEQMAGVLNGEVCGGGKGGACWMVAGVSERVIMVCGGICVRLDAHLHRKLAHLLNWRKTPSRGGNTEIMKLSTFLHGRPAPHQSAHSFRPACKSLSLAGGLLTMFDQGGGRPLWA